MRALGTRDKVQAFCSVTSGSGMTDLADRSHCKPKWELMIQSPHLWGNVQHTEMVWTWAPPSLTGCSSLNVEGKVTVPWNTERSTQGFRARNTLLEPMQAHLSLHNGHLPEVFWRQGLTTILRDWILSGEYWEQANGLHGSQVRSQVPAGICL